MVKNFNMYIPRLSLQEEFAPFVSLRGSSTGVVARVESLRGRMGESTRQVEGRVHRDLEGLSPEGDALRFESLLAEAFS